MRRVFRPSIPADAPAIIRLFAHTGLRPNIEPDHLEWKYWRPRADWPGPRSFVLADGAEIVAHCALVPGICAWEATEVPMIHLIDWAGRPEVPGAGRALLRHIGQHVREGAALLAIGGSPDTLRLLPHLGFRRFGEATHYVRPLFPWRMLRGAGLHDSLVRLPRVMRGLAWALPAPSTRLADWRLRELGSDEIDAATSIMPAPTRGMTVMRRSAEGLHYMLGCPIAPITLHVVEHAGRLRGYFLLTSVPGQVRIADCWVDSAARDDWRAMILCAVEAAKLDSQAAEVVIWASEPELAGTLESCGFHARGAAAIQVLPAPRGPTPPAPLRVQMLDNDAAFFHEPGDGYWA